MTYKITNEEARAIAGKWARPQSPGYTALAESGAILPCLRAEIEADKRVNVGRMQRRSSRGERQAGGINVAELSSLLRYVNAVESAE